MKPDLNTYEDNEQYPSEFIEVITHSFLGPSLFLHLEVAVLGKSIVHVTWFRFVLQQLSRDFSRSQGTDSSAMSSVSAIYEGNESYFFDSLIKISPYRLVVWEL